MAPIPPILSTGHDVALPEALKSVDSQAIPSSVELTKLNNTLATLSASAKTRADALRRDIDLLQQTYASLRARVKSEQEKTSTTDQRPDDNSDLASGSLQLPLKDHSAPPSGEPTMVKLLHQSNGAQNGIDTLIPDQGDISNTMLADKTPAELCALLGVAAYPTVDLSSLLPGVPSTEDYSKQKIPNQIAMNTFQSSIDPLFRNFTEEDIGWLRDSGDLLTPFIIPPLGPHYLEVWNETDETPPPTLDSTQRPRECAELLTDDNIHTDTISCGPLTTRLLSAFIKEGDSTVKAEDDATEKEKPGKLGAFKLDYTDLEARVNTELNFIGILDNQQVDWTQTSDDEISATLRALQAQLTAQTSINTERKRKLTELTNDEMAKDEYTTILDDLDKQVEQAFLKRTRSIKAKKKQRPGEKGTAISKIGIGSNIRAICDKRQKWITKIGVICVADARSKPSVTESVFKTVS